LLLPAFSIALVLVNLALRPMLKAQAARGAVSGSK
jgi:hypothetical protein